MSRVGLSQPEVLSHLRDWRDWMARDGEEPCPAFVDSFRAQEPSFPKMLGGLILHVSLALSYHAASGLRLHRVAARIAQLRIATDALSYEPLQCGWNAAYCNLGVAYVRLGRIGEAIDCLDEAWRVYPCPHDASFGLKLNLCEALSPYAEATESIALYRQLNAAFRYPGRGTARPSPPVGGAP